MASSAQGGKESLALDVEELRRRLGPTKVRWIDLWIREVNGPLNEAIAPHVNSESIILDVGCSRGDPDLPALREGRFLIGCDVDMAGLRANRIADGLVRAPMGSFPLADESVDVIVGKWLLEHLEDPARDFRECRRVLRPGGVLVALTPNALSLFTLASRMTPYRAKQWLKGRMFGIHEEDTFRTWYRANTRRRIEQLVSEAGLETVEFTLLPGMYTFFLFLTPLVGVVRLFERMMLRLPVLRRATSYIIGVWRKV